MQIDWGGTLVLLLGIIAFVVIIVVTRKYYQKWKKDQNAEITTGETESEEKSNSKKAGW